MSRANEAATLWTALDSVALLVANAKQNRRQPLKSYYIVSANKRKATRLWSVAVSEPFCVEIKTLSAVKSTKYMMSSRQKRYLLIT